MTTTFSILWFMLPAAAAFVLLLGIFAESCICQDSTNKREQKCQAKVYFWTLIAALALAGPVGLGTSSVLYFLWCILSGPQAPGYGACEGLIVLGLFGFGITKARFYEWHIKPKGLWPIWVVAAAAAILLLLDIRIVEVLHFLKQSPHGQWDAWAIWNLRARFIFRGGDFWVNAFSGQLAWSHPDYPLLLPMSIARGWMFMGTESKAFPLIFSLVFLLSLPLIMLAFFGVLKGWKDAVVIVGFFLLQSGITSYAQSQYADLPYATMLFAALFLFLLRNHIGANNNALTILCGFASALCSWTKNEGITAYLVISALFSLAHLSAARRKQLYLFFAGSAPVLAALVLFKTCYAPKNDLINSGTAFAKVFIAERYETIFSAVSSRMAGPYFGSLLLLCAMFVVFGSRYQPKQLSASGLACLALAGLATCYLFAYVLTPRDLQWHLQTSMDRLFFHLHAPLLAVLMLALPNLKRERETLEDKQRGSLETDD